MDLTRKPYHSFDPLCDCFRQYSLAVLRAKYKLISNIASGVSFRLDAHASSLTSDYSQARAFTTGLIGRRYLSLALRQRLLLYIRIILLSFQKFWVFFSDLSCSFKHPSPINCISNSKWDIS